MKRIFTENQIIFKLKSKDQQKMTKEKIKRSNTLRRLKIFKIKNEKTKKNE